jgi:peptidoglycan/LPS O-acetylase OafA/YrhL
VDSSTAPLGYLPQLDGLRALAVLAVMLFHANVSWAKGGFLGVDVFFVLSGFLITRLLLEEQLVTRALALGRFYLRRVLRLYPALIAVSIACLIYAWVWLPHDQAVQALRDVLATATYHMNWIQALDRHPPFFGLLDHAWSLSIEEQFYVVWPLALLLAFRVGGTRAVGMVAGIGAAASALWRVILLQGGATTTRVYFGLDTHADGLLIGCVLACLTVARPSMRRTSERPAWRFAGPVGLVLITIAMATVALHSRALYDWGYLVFVVVTAIVVLDLYAGGETSRVLHFGPAVAVGRISYGLYLWHWPVYLVLNAGRIHWAFVPLTLLRLAVSGAIAVLSYVLVEQPFLRLKRRMEPKALAPVRAEVPLT